MLGQEESIQELNKKLKDEAQTHEQLMNEFRYGMNVIIDKLKRASEIDPSSSPLEKYYRI